MSKKHQFTAKVSHSFPDGPSGPARTYWTFRGRYGEAMPTIPLHPTKDRRTQSDLTAETICGMLETAYQQGLDDKAHEIRMALGAQGKGNRHG